MSHRVRGAIAALSLLCERATPTARHYTGSSTFDPADGPPGDEPTSPSYDEFPEPVARIDTTGARSAVVSSSREIELIARALDKLATLVRSKEPQLAQITPVMNSFKKATRDFAKNARALDKAIEA